MSSLGKLGRFGNQLSQYIFLRVCAHQSGAGVECPPWAGQSLFGLHDSPISTKLPPAIEQWEGESTLFDAIPELIPYIESLAGAKSVRVGFDALEHGVAGVDLWGFFQVPTRLLSPHKQFIRSLFQPVPALRQGLDRAREFLRSKGRTVIGMHIRRCDFLELPIFGFTYPVPLEWWREWLQQIWRKLDRPVLLLCSDAIDDVLPAFAEYSPVTHRDLPFAMPEEMRESDFYADFHMLTQCDVLCISNSTFSFSASLLNESGKLFFRPHWDFNNRFTEFDPWNSDQLLYYGSDRPKLFKTFPEALHVARMTGGLRDLLSCSYVYPREQLKMKFNRIRYGYKLGGITGGLRSVIQPMRT
jgi:hypothetical protein